MAAQGEEDVRPVIKEFRDRMWTYVWNKNKELKRFKRSNTLL